MKWLSFPSWQYKKLFALILSRFFCSVKFLSCTIRRCCYRPTGSCVWLEVRTRRNMTWLHFFHLVDPVWLCLWREPGRPLLQLRMVNGLLRWSWMVWKRWTSPMVSQASPPRPPQSLRWGSAHIWNILHTILFAMQKLFCLSSFGWIFFKACCSNSF